MKDNRKTSDSNPEKAALENNQLAGTEMKHQPNEGNEEIKPSWEALKIYERKSLNYTSVSEQTSLLISGGHEEAKSASGEVGFPEAPRSIDEKVREEPLSIEADNPRSRDGEEAKSSSRKAGDVEAPNLSEKTAFQQLSSITGESTSSISGINSESALEDIDIVEEEDLEMEKLLEPLKFAHTCSDSSKREKEMRNVAEEVAIVEVHSWEKETICGKASCSDSGCQQLKDDTNDFRALEEIGIFENLHFHKEKVLAPSVSADAFSESSKSDDNWSCASDELGILGRSYSSTVIPGESPPSCGEWYEELSGDDSAATLRYLKLPQWQNQIDDRDFDEDSCLGFNSEASRSTEEASSAEENFQCGTAEIWSEDNASEPY
ncbi:hypothetical protein T10_12718 [Trichinella papuae]|uniref:Uncharacterized protein n=1 Tax=Trichinella papuae TaxID=268474 RepID=A0A0V1M6L6_9BILA|nr:hypothetical protein T10_12718 [Trichinella papuae]